MRQDSKPRRPSPALVIACLALFCALGGTVWAASRIDGHRIRPRSLPGNRLMPGSVSGDRLKPGSVGADALDLRGLGEVPSAAHATGADVARTAGDSLHAVAADNATRVGGYVAGCAVGTRLFAGACWEGAPRATAVDPVTAAAECAASGGELPGALALAAFARTVGAAIDPNGEWSSDFAGETGVNEFAIYTVLPGGIVSSASKSASRTFRCVIPLLH